MNYIEVRAMQKQAQDKWNAQNRALRDEAYKQNTGTDQQKQSVKNIREELNKLTLPSDVKRQVPTTAAQKAVLESQVKRLEDASKDTPWYNGKRSLNKRMQTLKTLAGAKTKQEYQNAIATGSNYEKDMALQLGAAGDWLEQLRLRAPSYAAWIAGSSLLGRLIAGKKRRWLGYGLGALLGAGANYARRKSYYGDAVTW